MADLAHELRTPMASIEATVEAIADRVLPADDETLATLSDQVAATVPTHRRPGLGVTSRRTLISPHPHHGRRSGSGPGRSDRLSSRRYRPRRSHAAHPHGPRH